MGFRAGTSAVAVAVVLASAWIAAQAPLGVDYLPDFRSIDTARPQIDALADGDLSRFVHEQSPLGPVSLILRAPLAAVAGAGDQLTRYRLGSFPCILALALAGLAVAVTMRRRGSPAWHCALVLGVFLVASPIHQALVWGHPEELLAAALVVAAALSAGTRRPGWAVAFQALAIATKPTAALAVVVIALMARDQRLRVAFLAVAIGVALVVPLAVADGQAFRDAASRANAIRSVKPMSIWWRASSERLTVRIGRGETRTVRHPRLGNTIANLIRTVIVVLSVLVALLAARAGPLTLERGFMVLALVFLLRCMLDPGDQGYYHVPFLVCLAAGEGLRRRPPLLAVTASILLSTPALRAVNSDYNSINLLHLAWSIPVAAVLGWSVLRRPSVPSVGARVGTA